MKRKRAAILISGRGSNMRALIKAAQAADFPAEITLVLSNSADAGGLAFARAAGIAAEVIEHHAFGKDRAAFDAAMHDALTAHATEIVCLAGFMRLLTAAFCDRWLGRIINIHPSLLPSFKGLGTHTRALEAGVRVHGCTVHFVTPGMDEGPVIAQAAVAVLPGDTQDTLAARVLEQEHQIYPIALAALASGALTLTGGRVTYQNTGTAGAALISPWTVRT